MPQVSPMDWLMMLLFWNFLFLFTMIFIYYLFTYSYSFFKKKSTLNLFSTKWY
uniref:ATP synthase F0 subunit 8 n=1 Tax=Zele chlorophthalmus TaxID=1080924 RepID=A0A345X0Q5_ZELCH|nr:ATP synthase F0 subunit 8 [Zele chlorophthalmus]AXK15297.1 ATP synthase F0 subunit 8 [Zele chlorophthalmus]